jgi:hypothetical protein
MGESNGRLPHKGNNPGDVEGIQSIALVTLRPKIGDRDSVAKGVSVGMAIPARCSTRSVRRASGYVQTGFEET